MAKNDYYFGEDFEEVKAKALKLARGISLAGKMVKVSGERIRLPLEGRELEGVFYPALDDNGQIIPGSNPLIIGFHGGGFLFGGCALDDHMWLNISQKLHVNIVSVGYRKGPEFDWCESLKDGIDAIRYIYTNAASFSSDQDNISLMGQSAGAMLTASILIKKNMDRDGFKLDEKFKNVVTDSLGDVQIKNSIMVYPLLDIATDPDIKGEGSLTGTICRVFEHLHCPDINVYNPLVSPIFTKIECLKGSPNTIIIYCDNDNLKHEAKKYAKMLNEAGTNAATMFAKGMPHGFFESGFKEPSAFEYAFLGENGHELYESGALNFWAEKTIDFIRENMK